MVFEIDERLSGRLPRICIPTNPTFYREFNNLALVCGELTQRETDRINCRNFCSKGQSAAEDSTIINLNQWSARINCWKLYMKRDQTLAGNDPGSVR
jgi:hypothetical protein